jgi:hypothetical protein
MNKILVTLLFSASAFSDTLVLEYSEDCCKKNPIEINLISINSVDGIGMEGSLSAINIGDMRNTITGPAELTFYRQTDNQNFAIKAPLFGFKPPDECIYDFYDESIGKCLLNSQQTIGINESYDYLNDINLITIENSILKVIQLFNFSRGYSSYDVYRIINTKDRFEAKFLYNFPETAKWNESGSFSYHLSGGAVIGTDITIDQIDGKWIKVKKVEYECWDPEYTNNPQVYKVYEYDKKTKGLVLITNETNCPN